MMDLNGWTHVGEHGSKHIYAKGKQRRLIDPKTGKTTFEYGVVGDAEHGGINMKSLVSARMRKGNENAKL